MYVCKIPRTNAYTIAEKAIRFRHPDYNPDLAQKLISSSMSRHLLTRNISSKSMHAFLSRPSLVNRQTCRQTDKRGQTHLPPSLSEVMKYCCVHRAANNWDCDTMWSDLVLVVIAACFSGAFTFLHLTTHYKLNARMNSIIEIIVNKKLISRWGRRTLPPVPRHRS